MGSLRGGRISALLLTLLLVGCGELTPPGERGGVAGNGNSYTVRRGDTLYSISWDAGLDARTVAAWNNIPPPYTIYPGQQLSLTAPLWTPPARDPSPRQNSVKSTNSRGGKTTPSRINHHGKSPTKITQKSNIEKSASVPQNITTTWRWPTQGKLVERFDVASGKKGIDISGRRGQEIYSAAAGDVVYSGNGLLGYGNLVIIKHDDIYLSAYGHNSQLLVKEGDRVTAGQKIAEMGVSPKDGAILHFEIRREGKPVDPLTYLPKRN